MQSKKLLKILVITQARFSSNRLPGKILLDLGGKKALEQVLIRLKNIDTASNVVCAIAKEKNSSKIIDLCKKNDVNYYLGSKANVLERIYFAAKKYDGDIIVRVTSDCPLIDPFLCNKLVKILIKKNLDYVSNNIMPSFPHGLDCEVFRFKSLEKAYKYSLTKPVPSHLEHVTTYLKNNNNFKKMNLKCTKKMQRYERWTLDTVLDYKFLNKVFKKIKDDEYYFKWENVLSLINKNKNLQNINNTTHHFWF